MNTNTISTNTTNNSKGMAWYRVPILWLMISLLSFTVVSGVYLFFLAHDTNDTIVLDKNYVPLNKKQANQKIPSANKP